MTFCVVIFILGKGNRVPNLQATCQCLRQETSNGELYFCKTQNLNQTESEFLILLKRLTFHECASNFKLTFTRHIIIR